MNTLVPIILVVLAASATIATNTGAQNKATQLKKLSPDNGNRVSKLNQLANLVKQKKEPTTVRRLSATRSPHTLNQLPRTAEQERIENLERTYARKLEAYLANKELGAEISARKAEPQTSSKSKELSRKALSALSARSMDRDMRDRYAIEYGDDDQDMDDLEYDQYLEEEQIPYDSAYLSDMDRYHDVTRYFDEQQQGSLDQDLLYAEDDYSDDDEEENQYLPTSYGTSYDEETYQVEDDLYPEIYAQPRNSYQATYKPVPSYRAVPEQPKNYVNTRKSAASPPSTYYPATKKVPASGYINRKYQPTPEKLSNIYKNQYQGQLSFVDNPYEQLASQYEQQDSPYEQLDNPYEQLNNPYEQVDNRREWQQVQYLPQPQIPSVDTKNVVAAETVKYEEPVTEATPNTTTATELAKPEQTSNATETYSTKQNEYALVPILADKSVLVVIEGAKSEENSEQPTDAKQSSAQDQTEVKSDPKPDVAPAQESEIAIPVDGAERIMATYIKDKPDEATSQPVETIAKLSATKRRPHFKSTLRRKTVATKKQPTRASLADVVRNYLKSKSH